MRLENHPQPLGFDPESFETPCHVVDEARLEENLRILGDVQAQTGVKIILALKGFAMFSTFPLIRKYLPGATASSLDEALLAHREFGGEVHLCAPAYSDADMAELVTFADHIVFNSLTQWERHSPAVRASGREPACGLRINPGYSEVATEIYNPCAPCSRLGIPVKQLGPTLPQGISGLHFHTLCEQNSDTLERTLEVVESKVGRLFGQIRWINFGGGHHVTRPDYEIGRLCRLLSEFRKRHNLEIYLEPGEAIALRTGYLVASVLDLISNGMEIALLDTSATAHMPDVLEMPYRPEIAGAGQPGEHPHTYRLGGLTCLAGDVIGDYSFASPLQIGQKLVFQDMAHYTMVKNTTFNGIRLPSIHLIHSGRGESRLIRKFGHQDYRNRLS